MFAPAAGRAQDVVGLSLAEATARALAHNHDIAVQRESVALAEQSARRAEGAYDTQLRVDLRGLTRTEPINNIFSGAPAGALGPRTTSAATSVGFSRLFSSGATASASTSFSFDGTNNVFSPLSPSYFTTLGVDLRQPLLQGRAIDPARRAIRIAAVDRARSTFTLRRTASDVIAALERAYWSLAAARRDVSVRRQSVALAEEQRGQTQVRIEAGTAAETEIAQPTAEVERRKGDVYASEEALQRAELLLKQLILDSADDPLWDTEIETDELPPAARSAIDVRAAIARAVAERPEVGEAAQALARQDIEIDAARDRLRPALDLVARYNMRGLAGSGNDGLLVPFPGVTVNIPPDLVGPVWQSYVNLFEQRFTDIALGVQMSVPLGNRAAQADLATTEIARRQIALTRDQLIQRIAAEVQLQAERDRYEAGLTTDFFVLTRQNDLAQARLAETAALVDYQKAATEYARATGSLLDERGVAVQAPEAQR
jgi:outer membrane protein TolC